MSMANFTFYENGDRSMYNGDNKAALSSQRLIADALLNLMSEHSFSDITISDLCRKAQVSRQTFYSLFGTKENVIMFELRQNCYIPENSAPMCRSASFRSFCRGYSSYIIRSNKIIKLLVDNGMLHFLHSAQYHSLMDCPHFFGSVTGRDREFLVEFIAGGMNSIAKSYIQSGGGDSGYIEKQMFRLFGGLYFIEENKGII